MEGPSNRHSNLNRTQQKKKKTEKQKKNPLLHSATFPPLPYHVCSSAFAPPINCLCSSTLLPMLLRSTTFAPALYRICSTTFAPLLYHLGSSTLLPLLHHPTAFTPLNRLCRVSDSFHLFWLNYGGFELMLIVLTLNYCYAKTWESHLLPHGHHSSWVPCLQY